MSDSKSGTKFTDYIDEDAAANNKDQFNKVYYEKPNESTDILSLARTLFDMKEYRKCANLLKPYTSPKY
jgi:Anaphase promoting complex subunit 8 / Cdc23